ncbi:hypothetical protein BJV74DRAFT_782557 [Russula compacta]|nr:hypothetical protein BJV74DRAFT_782557 [Russula compacta]
MREIIVKIITEVLSIVGIAMKEIKQSRAKAYVRKLVGKTEMADALRRLDRLTEEEIRMAAAQGLKATHDVHTSVEGVNNKVQQVDDKVQDVDKNGQGVDDRVRNVDDIRDVVIDVRTVRDLLSTLSSDSIVPAGNQIRRDLRNWLSPPDPSINYNTASDARHKGTATWFAKNTAFADWKASGSLLWIHGKRASWIIRNIQGIREAESAHIAYFFFDFKDAGKQDVRALLSSLVIQLSNQSDHFCDVLFRYHSTHQSGSQIPSDPTLIQCLEDMLRVPGQVPIYIIIDALDECPNMRGMPTPREWVLDLVEELVSLKLPNLRLCVTSRPEVDIRTCIEPLTHNQISLHDQYGQKKDIVDYVCSVVYSDRNMRRWREEDKKMVIETLSERANGM